MSDDESDTSNVFTFQNATTVSAKGPNTNITNLSFRHPMSSTMFMPRNFERQRYAESSYDQRSMYYRRETSPMSIRSACDERPRNFQQYYPGMSSQRSVFNGRSGSPMSMRSIDSSASVSAADIAFAFKNVKFNKYDLKVIKDAYHKLMKQRVRKRIERRRNMRLFLKGSRQGSGDDSGEQGSNSSVSSDDCRSVKTSYKENMSSSRSARIDLKSFKDSNMVKDCSENFRQNSFRNKFSVGSNINPFNSTVASKQPNPIPTQKDRFRNRSGFLLPSQRFNQSVASSAIMENTEKPPKVAGKNMNSVKNHYSQNINNNNGPSASEDEEIFSEMTVREKSTYNVESHGKRSLDSEDDTSLPERKRTRIISPIKNAPNTKKAPTKPSIAPCQKGIEMSNSFEFAKPMLPVWKSRPKVQEKLIAKSHTTSLQPLNDFVEPVPQTQNNLQSSQPSKVQEKPIENVTQMDQSETSQISDISSRPSFIKRKLFTQKMDVAEKANLSNDGTNSPQASVYALQKEKNKARKLVTNQSCLNREVQDENNLLDLIHKIVPPDRINLTNQTTMNQTKLTDVNSKSKQDNEDKWDVTSVISMCNDEDVSDTFTDEEIFKPDNTKEAEKNKNTNNKVKEKNKEKGVNSAAARDCKIVLEKIQYNNTLQKQVVNQNFNLTHNNVTKPNMTSSVKTFWDTDFESDAECQAALPRNNQISNYKNAIATFNNTKQDFITSKSCEKNEIFKKTQNVPEVPKHLKNTSMNNTVMNNTMNSMSKFNVSTLSVRSHRTSKKKKCWNETTLTNEIKSNLDYLSKFSSDKKKESKTVEKKIEKVDPKPKSQSKFSTETPKPKSNKQNDKQTSKGKSATQSKKSPKEKSTTANKDKKVTPNKSTSKKLESKAKTTKSNSANSSKLKSKSETQKPSSPDKNKEVKKVDSTKVKTNSKPSTQNNNQKVSPKKKPKSKNDRQNNSIRANSKNRVSQSTKSNLNSTIETKLNDTVRKTRPVRSCRTPSQNRSIEASQSSQLNNISIDGYKSLRSRVINLSSSIDTSIKIKPRNKTINNKNISLMSKRQSDISFSLGSAKQTPTPKKNLARNRADFFKGKRKA